METLRERHSDSDFEAVMRPYAVDSISLKALKMSFDPGASPPANVRFQYMPRIKCHDCPSKLYTALPDSVIDDFEVHLRNRKHRDAVQTRLNGE